MATLTQRRIDAYLLAMPPSDWLDHFEFVVMAEARHEGDKPYPDPKRLEDLDAAWCEVDRLRNARER